MLTRGIGYSLFTAVMGCRNRSHSQNNTKIHLYENPNSPNPIFKLFVLLL